MAVFNIFTYRASLILVTTTPTLEVEPFWEKSLLVIFQTVYLVHKASFGKCSGALTLKYCKANTRVP